MRKSNKTFYEILNLEEYYNVNLNIPVGILMLNTKEKKICKELKIKTVNDLVKIPFRAILNIDYVGRKTIINLKRKILSYVKNYDNIKEEFEKINSYEDLILKMSEYLPERERKIFLLRYLENKTLQAIGNEFGGLTRERIRQILENIKDRFNNEFWKKLVKRKLENEPKRIFFLNEFFKNGHIR